MVTIRKYQEKDRELVRNICKETCDKKVIKTPLQEECVCHMFIDYYLDYENDNCFVATDENDNAVGYIVCSSDKEKFKEKDLIYVKKVFKKSFFLGLFDKICHNQSVKQNAKFGCGFHINITEKSQGEHIGPKLLTTLGLHLKKKGEKYMYLITKNRKTRGYGFYTHFGFEEKQKTAGGSLCLTFDLSKIEEKQKKYLS